MLQRKLCPVICQLVVAEVASPHHLVILGSLSCRSERQVHSEHVLGVMCFRLNSQVSLTRLPGLVGPRLRLLPRRRQSPATLVRFLHDSRRQVRVCIVSVPVQMKQVAREMGHNGARLRGSQQAYGTAVPEESKITVVCDDVNGAAPPRGLAGRCLTHANIVDGANVAAVEANARPRPKHVFPRRVRRRDQRLGSDDAVVDSSRGERGELRLCHAQPQRGCSILWLPFLGGLRVRPVVVHARETKLGPEGDVAPYGLLRGNEVREGLADERQAGEVTDVVDSHVAHDVDEEFAGERRDGGGARGRALDLGGRRLDSKTGEAGYEMFDGEEDDWRAG